MATSETTTFDYPCPCGRGAVTVTETSQEHMYGGVDASGFIACQTCAKIWRVDSRKAKVWLVNKVEEAAWRKASDARSSASKAFHDEWATRIIDQIESNCHATGRTRADWHRYLRTIIDAPPVGEFDKLLGRTDGGLRGWLTALVRDKFVPMLARKLLTSHVADRVDREYAEVERLAKALPSVTRRPART